MQKTYNIYCDESCHIENDGKEYMILSYTKVPYHKIKRYKKEIAKIRDKHKFNVELKWSKVSGAKQDFYIELIDFFFNSEIEFRAIIVKKEQIENGKYEQDFDTFYYKMYYQLIHHKINVFNNYNIFLDIKDTLGVFKIRKLRKILNVKYGVIRTLQNIRSHESVFLQITDLIMGAINYKINEKGPVETKNKIIERLEEKANVKLENSTWKSTEKFNLFHINLDRR